jgi:hypothetical protein
MLYLGIGHFARGKGMQMQENLDQRSSSKQITLSGDLSTSRSSNKDPHEADFLQPRGVGRGCFGDGRWA